LKTPKAFAKWLATAPAEYKYDWLAEGTVVQMSVSQVKYTIQILPITSFAETRLGTAPHRNGYGTCQQRSQREVWHSSHDPGKVSELMRN